MNRREADVAIRLHKASQGDVIEKHMTTLKFVLCASKRYLDQYGRPKKIDDFNKHQMIGYPPNKHAPFEKPNSIFSKLGIRIENNPNITLINSMNTRYSAVKSGSGIAVLPVYTADYDDDLEILLPELKIPSVDMYFVYPQERKHSKRIKVLREFMFDYIKQTPS